METVTITLTSRELEYLTKQVVRKIISEKARIVSYHTIRQPAKADLATQQLHKLLNIQSKLKAS